MNRKLDVRGIYLLSFQRVRLHVLRLDKIRRKISNIKHFKNPHMNMRFISILHYIFHMNMRFINISLEKAMLTSTKYQTNGIARQPSSDT